MHVYDFFLLPNILHTHNEYFYKWLVHMAESDVFVLKKLLCSKRFIVAVGVVYFLKKVKLASFRSGREMKMKMKVWKSCSKR